MKVCQSCGMPMEDQKMYGKNTDGTPNSEYCTYCYPSGAFNNPDETMEEMIASCIPFMVQKGFSEEQARTMLADTLPHLKRWKR